MHKQMIKSNCRAQPVDGRTIVPKRCRNNQALGAAQDTVTDTVTVMSLDGTTHTVTVTIEGENDAPELVGGGTAGGGSVVGNEEEVDPTIATAAIPPTSHLLRLMIRRYSDAGLTSWPMESLMLV